MGVLKSISKAIIALIIAITGTNVFFTASSISDPTCAYAVDATNGKEYSNALLGGDPGADGSATWDGGVLDSVSSDSPFGDDPTTLATAGWSLLYDLVLFALAIVVVLFVFKMVGRAALTMSINNGGREDTVPKFFMNSAERKGAKAGRTASAGDPWFKVMCFDFVKGVLIATSAGVVLALLAAVILYGFNIIPADMQEITMFSS